MPLTLAVRSRKDMPGSLVRGWSPVNPARLAYPGAVTVE
jgi:hypothetical protein